MSAKVFWTVLSFSLAPGFHSVSAHAQAEAVALTDLDGAVVTFDSMFQEKIIRNGEIRYPRLHTVGRLTIGPGEKLAASVQSTSILPDGRTKAGERKAGVFEINKPQKNTSGSDTVWLFADASLVRLRVFGGAGGDKMTFAFTRGNSGLQCALSYPMTPEVGVGKIRKRSAVDGTPIQILEYKLTSSTCQVAKNEPVAAQKK